MHIYANTIVSMGIHLKVNLNYLKDRLIQKALTYLRVHAYHINHIHTPIINKMKLNIIEPHYSSILLKFFFILNKIDNTYKFR